MRILLVEDTGVELDELTKGFVEISSKLGFDCKIVRAQDKVTASNLSEKFLYHLVSLDQNIPSEESPNTSTIIGFELAEELARKKRCFHGTIYTNVPEKDKMVSLISTGFQYREKSVRTDQHNNCFTPEDYTKLVFLEALDSFPIKVFKEFMDGGFHLLSGYSGNITRSFSDLISFRTDSSCTKFYNDFFPFFEHSLWLVSALVHNIATSLKLKIATLPTFKGSRPPTSANLLDWLRTAMDKIRSDRNIFCEFEEYFTHGSEFKNLNEYFLEACNKLKSFRNSSVHTAQVVSYDEHKLLFPYLLRYLDILSVLATATIAYQPRRLGKGLLLDCTQLNARFPSTQQVDLEETDFQVLEGDSLSEDAILVRLPRLGLVSLSEFFEVSRDERTRSSRLEFSPWFNEGK